MRDDDDDALRGWAASDRVTDTGEGSDLIADDLARGAAKIRRQRVLDALPGLWFCFSADARYVDAGGPLAEFGRSREALLGRSIDDIVPLETANHVRQGIALALAEGRVELEFRLQRGGTERLFEAVFVSISATEVVTFVRDATDRSEAQRRLSDSEQRFRAVVELANEGVWMVDADGMTTFATARMAEIVGCDAAEMLGRSPCDFMDDESRQVYLARQARRRRGETETSSFSFRRRDGAAVETIAAASPIHDREGLYIGAVAVVSDETERRGVERQLHESQRRLGAIAEAHDDVLYAGEIRPDGTYHELFSGPGTHRLLGGTAPAADQLGPVWGAAVHVDDRGIYEQMNARLLAGLPADGEYRLVGVDGVVRWVHDRARPRPTATGVAVDGVVSDVTHRRVQADALALALAEIREAHAALEEAHAGAQLMARTDVLTGLFNRRHFGDALAAELARAERQGLQTGLLLLDIDHFKRINDSHGHECGDQVLTVVAERLVGSIRPYDVVARWGGEEFVVLVADVPDEAALRRIGGHLLEAIRSAPIDSTGGALTVTASTGAALHQRGATGDTLIDAADQALYAAKRRGRDRVVLARDLVPSDIAPEEPEAVRLAEGLAIAASIREAVPPLHCQQVADLAELTARELGVPSPIVLRCRLAGWLHDVGKLAIPDQILSRAGALDEDDRAILRRHVDIGAAIVGGLPSLSDAAAGVRHHHERFDGSGYPAALAGDRIPLEARVVAACDAYSAITAGRAYQPALEHDQALAQLDAAAGVSLDPIIVTALKRVLDGRQPLRPAA